MPPMMGSVGVPAAMDQGGQPGQGSPDQARQQLEAVMGQIRELGQQVEQLGSQLPAMAPEVKQIREILKRMIVKAAQQGSPQSGSAQALPG